MLLFDITQAASGFSAWMAGFTHWLSTFTTENADFVAVIILFLVALYFAWKIMDSMYGGEGGGIHLKLPPLPKGIFQD